MFVYPLLCLAIATGAPEPDLLKIARPIVIARGWREDEATIGRYTWLSPDHLMAFFSDGASRVFGVQEQKFLQVPTPNPDQPYGSISPQ